MTKKSPPALEELSDLDLVDLLDFEDYVEVEADNELSLTPNSANRSRKTKSAHATTRSTAYAQSLAVAQAYNLKQVSTQTTRVVETTVARTMEQVEVSPSSYATSSEPSSQVVKSEQVQNSATVVTENKSRNVAKPQSVSSLLAELNAELNYSNVYVEAEIASIAVRNNHAYLTLRDSNTNDHIPAHIADFKQKVAYLQKTTGCTLDDYQQGKKIEVYGQLNIYTKTGKLQIEVQRMRIMDGFGAMQLMLERVRKRIIEEGLDQYKQPIPKYPQRVGVVSSMQAAGLKDFLEKFRQLAPDIEIIVYESYVQGKWAEESLVRAIQRANSERQVDLLIVTRGGGAFEDLLPFSAYEVVKAVAMSELPIISAIGHQIDKPLIDDVADHACITPTDAAETVCLPRVKIRELLPSKYQKLRDFMRDFLLSYHNYIENNRKSLNQLKDSRLSKLSLRLQTLRADLQKQSPQAMLSNRRNNLLVVQQKFQLTVQRYLGFQRQRLQQEHRNLTDKLHYIHQLKQHYRNKIANFAVDLQHGFKQVLNSRKNRINLLANQVAYLKNTLAHTLSNDKAKLLNLKQQLHNNFMLAFSDKQKALTYNQLRFKRQFQLELQTRLEQVSLLTSDFFNLDPTLPLKRGFALVQNQQGELVSGVNQLVPGNYKLIFQDGNVDFVVSQTSLNTSEKSSLDFNEQIEQFKQQVAELRKLLQ